VCDQPFQRRGYDHEKSLRRGVTVFYCGHTCRAKTQRATPTCQACGDPAERKRKYCSGCRGKQPLPTRRLQRKMCPVCGTIFQPRSSRRVYCERQCANLAHARRMRGTGNSHFKAASSYTWVFREMKKIILDRDGRGCVVCNDARRKSRIVVHHIDEDPTNNHPENLIVLCTPCHMTHHKSAVTPFPWFALYARAASRSMTSRLKDQATSLLTGS
jgi:hypothetical protein